MARSIKDRIKALATVVANIEKQFGNGAIMPLGGKTVAQVETISSGSIALDQALGIGGFPRGRLVEIYGPESSGKTTLALHALADIQRRGGLCAFVDAEHALDVNYAEKLGVQTNEILVSQPDCGEQALEIADQLVQSGLVELVVIDSVAALVPRAELTGEMGDTHMGLQARLMSQAMRKLTGHAHKHNTAMIFINQTRQKIGVSYGSNVTTTGGNALKFYASVRLEIRRIGALKEGETVVGNRTRVKVVKNKMAPPFRQAEFDIVYGLGVHREAELLDLAIERGTVNKSGTWYALGETKLGQGRAAACRWLAENPEHSQRLEQLLRAPTPQSQAA
ncbi:MAG: recombinase RecA [Deltaproteobacteria bacterium]|nr:recombinase RecA [Deltaproteobacteria bacterium]